MQSYNVILRPPSCMQEIADGIVLYENDMLLASADDSKTAEYSSGASLASMNSVLVRDLVPHLCPDSLPADLGEVLSAAVPLPSHKIVQAFSGEVLSSLGPPSSPKPVIDALRLPTKFAQLSKLDCWPELWCAVHPSSCWGVWL